MDLHERFKAERERLALTQPQLAVAVGVGKTTVINWEKGSSSPTALHLAQLTTLGFDVLYVLTGQRSQPAAAPALTRDEEALLDNYKHADDEGRLAAQQVLTALSKQRKKAA